MRYLFIVIIFFIFTGCSFKSSHTRFIDSMGSFVSGYNNYEKEKEKWFKISDKYLVSTTSDHNGNTLYHFNWDTENHDCPCRYYIVVDKEGTIIDWGFDPCDKEKCCRLVG